MKESTAKQHTVDWHRYAKERSNLDHEFSRLCFEIRRDAGSDEEARLFIIRSIGATSGEAGNALVRARAWEVVQNTDTWRAIGGFASAKIIATELTNKRQRMTLLTAAVEAAERAGRPIGPKKVRVIAWQHGFVVRKDKESTTQQHTEMLADLRRLVNSGAIKLDQLSASVRAIVRPPRGLKLVA